jgi:APA family basic amino acid/polyamine antiporter
VIQDWQPKPGDRFVRLRRAKAYPLKRALGVLGLFSAGYGDVGSSIYYALGLVVSIAYGAAPVALLVAGIFYVFTSLSYAEGTAMLPEAGGAASFARKGFNDFWALIAGWALIFSYVITMAISAYTVPAYLEYFWSWLREPGADVIFAIAIVSSLMCLNIVGVKKSTLLNISFVVLDILTQVIIVALAMLFLFDAQALFHNITAYWPSVPDFIFGIAVAAIAYTGIESISQLSEEARQPRLSVPRAYILTMAVVLILFCGISVAGFSTMTPLEMASQWARDPLAGIAHGLSTSIVPDEVAARLFSDPLAIGIAAETLNGLLRILPALVAILASTILIVATNAGLMGISRLTFSLGRFQLVPLFLSKVHPRFSTPYRSIILFASIAILFLLPGFFTTDIFSKLGGLYAFGSLLAFAFAHASIIRLRIKSPTQPRPFKIRGNIRLGGHELPLTAILGLIATGAIWIIVLIMHPYARWVGLGWLAVGVGGYSLFRHRKHLPFMQMAREIKVSN